MAEAARLERQASAEGTRFRLLSETVDAVDDVEFSVLVAGAHKLRCRTLDLSGSDFIATFSGQALASGDGLLAVSQGGVQGSESRFVSDDPREFAFDRTTPPFLLSRASSELVHRGQPLSLRFYDELDEGAAPRRLLPSGRATRTLEVNGVPTEFPVILYWDAEHDVGLEVLSGSSLVHRVLRMDGEYSMRLLAIDLPDP